MLKDVLYILVTGLSGTLVAFLCAFMKSKIAELNLDKYTNLALDAVIDACNSVAMTYVDELKKAGKFTKDAQANAKLKAMTIIDELINVKTKSVIETAYGDYYTWVNNKIESILKEQKEG